MDSRSRGISACTVPGPAEVPRYFPTPVPVHTLLHIDRTLPHYVVYPVRLSCQHYQCV